MITAHVPAGYVVGKSFGVGHLVLPAALVGSVFPDLDLIWFYLIDERAFSHRHYWVHAPFFWLVLAPPAMLVVHRLRRQFLQASLAFFGSVGLHLILDAPVGGIMWLWPISKELFALVEVPVTRSHWVLSLLTHWTALAELLVWAVALFIFFSTRNRKAP